MKREYLMLAHTYKPGKHHYAGWFASEKLDGMRAFWDGGISRGLFCYQVPYANTAKHARFVEAPIATGLWTRYGQPIHAPDYFLDDLPQVPLDGELWLGAGKFQQVTSCVKDHNPGPAWKAIRYMIFDSPCIDVFGSCGTIKNPNMTLTLGPDCGKWIREHTNYVVGPRPFITIVPYLRRILEGRTYVAMLEQTALATTSFKAIEMVTAMSETIYAKGGEGLILRNPLSKWEPARLHNLLKIKPFLDSEGTVTGYVWGKGKLLGLMGALKLKLDSGVELELSGFTDSERVICDVLLGIKMIAQPDGINNPGKPVSNLWHNPLFPRGSKVTFKYRELSDDGIPKEARFWRKHD